MFIIARQSPRRKSPSLGVASSLRRVKSKSPDLRKRRRFPLCSLKRHFIYVEVPTLDKEKQAFLCAHLNGTLSTLKCLRSTKKAIFPLCSLKRHFDALSFRDDDIDTLNRQRYVGFKCRVEITLLRSLARLWRLRYVAVKTSVFACASL